MKAVGFGFLARFPPGLCLVLIPDLMLLQNLPLKLIRIY